MPDRIDKLLARAGRILGTTADPVEELTLPEPAGRLWLEIHGLIERTFAQQGGCRLGGGTLLAARWKHRISVDIDLTIEPMGRRPQEIRNLIREENPFWREIERLGCGEPSAPSGHRIRIPFNESTLDISVLDAHPGAGEHQATVNGKSAALQDVINGSCRGWTQLPTGEELYNAFRAEKPTTRELALLRTWFVEATIGQLVEAWAQQAYSDRQLVRSIHRIGFTRTDVPRFALRIRVINSWAMR